MRFHRVIDIHDNDAGIGGDVEIVPGNRNVLRALQNIVFIPGDGAGQEIIAWLAVGKRIDIHQNQSFLGIGDKGVVVDWMEILLLVCYPHQFALVTQRCDGLIGRQCDATGVLRYDPAVLAHR